MSPTISGLQEMLNVCYALGSKLRLHFYAAKSHCIAFGKVSVTQPSYLGPDILMWFQSIRYLGVHVLTGKTISIDMNSAKR